MSINAIIAASAAELGNSGTLVGSTLHYLDSGRIQLIASTLIDPDGKRQTLIRPFVGSVSTSEVARQMIADWKAGTLAGMVSEGAIDAK